MNKLNGMMMAGALLLTACQSAQQSDDIIGKQSVTIENGIMTTDALMAFGRVTDPVVSPDKSKILYGVSYESVKQNKSNRELFVVDINGENKTQITTTAGSEGSAVWINGGKEIAYLSSKSGSSQLWIMNADGSKARQISNHEKGINGFLFSPDESKILFISNVKYAQKAADLYPDLDKASGRVIDDLMYKHWDEWVEEIPHPYIADFDGKKLSNVIDIMEGEPYEAPMKPFGGAESFSWTPDGKAIAYVSRKKTGLEYSISTNSDIYLYNLETQETRNLTEGMMGYDTNPTFSPDGKYLAWTSMKRDGYESDKNRLFILNMESGEKQDLTSDWDYSTDALAWSTDGESLFILAVYNATSQVFNVRLDKNIRQVTTGHYDYASLAPVSETSLIALRHSLSQPNEIYNVNLQTGEVIEISFENQELLAQITMGKVEERWIKTTDNKQMLTWIIYPPHFDPAKKYPAILYCQGGPQQPVSQFWSYRWNLQLMAANGYIVIAPNRRGLYGFGQEWLEQISGDYGGQNMRDYFSAVDAMKKEPFVDADNIGAVGASYGGFSVYWLAGHHEKRFKAFIAHAGIYNLEQQYVETEEMWFANWDMGGAPWDKKNAIAQRTFATSPHKFVGEWDTPILITHGEYDFRILASQGMAAFNAAKLRGIPAEMLIFPDENHWILKPQNGVLWQRIFFRWLDRWLKPQPEANTEDAK